MKIYSMLLMMTMTFQSLFANVSTEVKLKDSISLHLSVKNIKHKKGKIFIAIFNEKESFMKNHFADEAIPVNSMDEAEVEIKLPHGVYAISIFHDVNQNNELNTNFIGIPKEPYGFSNNPKITFGPPNFEQTSFDLTNDHQQIEIRLK